MEEIELKIIHEFIETGKRRDSFKKYNKKKQVTDYQIYEFFKRDDVRLYIKSIGSDLEIFDTICDKKLLNIINDTNAQNRDIISAIKIWNDLRKRSFLQIEIDETRHLDFTNVSDENLEKIVQTFIKHKDSIL